jgi:hypothetical protein
MQSHLCLYDSLKHWGKPKYLWALTTLYTFDVEYNFERHVRFGCWALCWAAICFRAKRNNDIHFGSPWSGASRTSTAGSTRARELSASGVAARQTQKFELDITSRLFSSSLVCGGFSHSVCLNLLCYLGWLQRTQLTKTRHAFHMIAALINTSTREAQHWCAYAQTTAYDYMINECMVYI